MFLSKDDESKFICFMLELYQSGWAVLTKHHRLGALSNRNSLSQGSGGSKSLVKVLRNSVSGEKSPLLVDGHLVSVSAGPFLCASAVRDRQLWCLLLIPALRGEDLRL